MEHTTPAAAEIVRASRSGQTMIDYMDLHRPDWLDRLLDDVLAAVETDDELPERWDGME